MREEGILERVVRSVRNSILLITIVLCLSLFLTVEIKIGYRMDAFSRITSAVSDVVGGIGESVQMVKSFTSLI